MSTIPSPTNPISPVAPSISPIEQRPKIKQMAPAYSYPCTSEVSLVKPNFRQRVISALNTIKAKAKAFIQVQQLCKKAKSNQDEAIKFWHDILREYLAIEPLEDRRKQVEILKKQLENSGKLRRTFGNTICKEIEYVTKQITRDYTLENARYKKYAKDADLYAKNAIEGMGLWVQLYQGLGLPKDDDFGRQRSGSSHSFNQRLDSLVEHILKNNLQEKKEEIKKIFEGNNEKLIQLLNNQKTLDTVATGKYLYIGDWISKNLPKPIMRP